MKFHDTQIPHPLVEQNEFRTMEPEDAELPSFEEQRQNLPQPTWEGHQTAIECYWKTWQLAFQYLRRPAPGSGFVANFIDTAFNDRLFLWDSVFILMFGRYGQRAFPFQRTLDNLYAKQHRDGFICREIDEASGSDSFHPHDPTSTGPNVLAWSEWEHFCNSADRGRLARVFPVLVAYHDWMRKWRTWPDGSYFSSGWGCGMDNQPRLPRGYHEAFDHGHTVWVDATLQAIFSAKLLLRMGGVLGRREQVAHLQEEVERLTRFVNDRLWDDREGFYFDMWPDGSLNGVKSVAAFWALLAGVAEADKQQRLIAHLCDESAFARPHPVPSLSADHPDYEPQGQYWRGAVWPPTNYMILRGLTECGRHQLAYHIARKHLENVLKVFEDTGTVWENYAPEAPQPGNIAKNDFVGWGGVPPVAVLLEYVFGLRPDRSAGRLFWDVRLLEGHGVRGYPFGPEGSLDLWCPARKNPEEKPAVEVRSTVPLQLRLHWQGGSEDIEVQPRSTPATE